MDEFMKNQVSTAYTDTKAMVDVSQINNKPIVDVNTYMNNKAMVDVTQKSMVDVTQMNKNNGFIDNNKLNINNNNTINNDIHQKHPLTTYKLTPQVATRF